MALRSFDLGGELLSVEPFGGGHINATFRSRVAVPDASGPAEFLHQRVNAEVFRDLDALMANIELITRTLRRRGHPSLELIPTRSGASHVSCEGQPWRTFRFERGTTSYDRCPSPDHAFAAARAFGAYQAGLSDLDPTSVRVTIPDFFDGRKRIAQFEEALRRSPAERLVGLESDLEFAREGTRFAGPIESAIRAGKLPPRIVHGDTKLNNLLFESELAQVRCVVDLDTTMNAWGPYDFGDLVRFTAATADEDERDLDLVDVDRELLHPLIAGWRESLADFAAPAEGQLLGEAATLVTYLVGLRFLTDHLMGDVYFRVHRPNQNLDRARTQFRLARRLQELSQEFRA